LAPGITTITTACTIVHNAGPSSKLLLHLQKGRPQVLACRAFLLSVSLDLDFEKSDGLITAVIQDHASGRVLMVGFMNREAFDKTLETGYATFYSRSRKKLWLKGESSGHRLVVKSIATDCDKDALLLKVEALGPGVCHNGYESCFYRQPKDGNWVEVDQPTYDPHAVYGSQH
jgi:phosphoribosyl-AMP cyclohydrolase